MFKVQVKRNNQWMDLHGYPPASHAICRVRYDYYSNKWQQYSYRIAAI